MSKSRTAYSKKSASIPKLNARVQIGRKARRFIGRGRHSHEYKDFINEAYTALAANKDFREALLATGRKRLYNAYALTDPSKTVLTGQEQCRALMRLRKKLKG